MATLALSGWFRTALGLAVFSAPAAGAASEAPPLLGPEPVKGGVPPGSSDTGEPRLTIVSDSACPSEQAVTEALSRLCPPVKRPKGTVRIHAAADVLAVELIADGRTYRQLRVTDECAVRAVTVALVIATWTGELVSDATEAPVLRGPAPAGKQAPVAPPSVRIPASASAVVAFGTERELGAGPLLAVSGGGAPGVHIDFVQTRAPSGLGFQVVLTLPARRERAADGASTSWTRAAVSVAINGRITWRRLAVSVEAGPAGAYTITSGHGYAIAQGAQALTAGFVAGARLALPWWRLCLWTDVRAYKWLLPQTVAVDSTAGGRVATLTLPSSDFHWALGLAYRFR